MAWRLRDHVSIARTEYGSVLLDQELGKYWQLNETGTLIAEELAAGSAEQEICGRLTAEYDIGAEQARADVDALIAELLAADMVTR
ncbi:lasso peptide biosynthesis PqqD family chaperone [Amycolatopsis sp. NPDC059657]|uniref:lasso peptide biosynthesis PqqD family chaperone n=1 Tax=Amycolatopsis sp. NPDC059657 TaxID=3346899 RepID=UPI00366D0FBB